VFRKIYMVDKTGQGRPGDEVSRLLGAMFPVWVSRLRRKRIQAMCGHDDSEDPAQTMCRCIWSSEQGCNCTWAALSCSAERLIFREQVQSERSELRGDEVIITMAIDAGALRRERDQASTIGISGTTLIFGADPDEQLALSGLTSATDLFLDGANPEIVTPGCVADATFCDGDARAPTSRLQRQLRKRSAPPVVEAVSDRV
jgi:hypothetical protein